MSRLALIAVLASLCLGAAACGSDDDDGGGGGTTAASEPGGGSAAAAPAPGPPAGAAALAERCSLGEPQQDVDFELPEGLLPPEAFVLRVDGDSAKIVFRSTLREAYGQTLANAERLGLTIERKELEGVDAELELVTDGGLLRFGFGTAGRCPNVSQATAIVEPG